MTQTNFIQICRTIECSSCKPEKGYADYHNVLKCDCKCHDVTKTNSQIKDEISSIFVKWSLPTRQIAINEIIKLLDSLLKIQREEIINLVEEVNCCRACTDKIRLSIIKEQ